MKELLYNMDNTKLYLNRKTNKFYFVEFNTDSKIEINRTSITKCLENINTYDWKKELRESDYMSDDYTNGLAYLLAKQVLTQYYPELLL